MVEVILHNMGILLNKGILHNMGTLLNKVIHLRVILLNKEGIHQLGILHNKGIHLLVILVTVLKGLMDTAVWEQCLLGVQLLLLLMVLSISPMALMATIHKAAMHMVGMVMVVLTCPMASSREESMASSKGESMASLRGESLASMVEDSRSGSKECICNYGSKYRGFYACYFINKPYFVWCMIIIIAPFFFFCSSCFAISMYWILNKS